MRLELIPFKPPNYDPYETCCAGSHDGEKLIIHDGETGGNPLAIEIQEIRSGLGNEFHITARTRDGQSSKVPLYIYVEDDGTLNFYVKGSDMDPFRDQV
jgi:hypothetical protein